MPDHNYQLYVWGANSHGQLGLGLESEMCWLPEALHADLLPAGLQRRLLHSAALREIRGGGGHVLMLTHDGAVFVGGWNNRGQLGVGTLTNSSRLMELDGAHFGDGAKVRAVRAGWECSAAITEAGDLYVWGSNVHGQLGIASSESLRYAHTPRKLEIPSGDDDRCVDVHFGLRFTVFVTRSAIYITAPPKLLAQLTQTAGAHRSETLVHPETGVTFAKVFVAAEHVACGVKHLLFTEANDLSRVHGCGDNRYGQCDAPTAECSTDGSISQLRSGWTHSATLRTDGTVILWGRNDYGQLGAKSAGNVLRFAATGGDNDEDDARVTYLQLGAEHGAILRSNGDVWTWGWNEHGNCGNGSEVNVLEPIRVALPGRCRLIGTGCGFCVALVEVGGTST